MIRQRFRRPSRLVLLLPTIIFLLFDFAMRGNRFGNFATKDWMYYVASVLESTIMWAALLHASRLRSAYPRRVATTLFLVFFTIALGGQAYFFEQYRAYLNPAVSRFATNFRESVLNQLEADLGNYLSFKIPALLVALVLVALARVVPSRANFSRRSQWTASIVALVALTASLVLPTQSQRRQSSSPDMLYMSALGSMFAVQFGLAESASQLHPRARKSLPVPQLTPRPSRPRNVVLVVLESVRKDATCNSYRPDCVETAATNQLFPDRIALPNLRALDSVTAISMAVLYSGVGPQENRDVLHEWPFIFDYAREAGYTTAYFTSQNILFGTMRLWFNNLGVDHFFSALDVDPESDIDMGAPESKFAEYALRRLPQLSEPFLLTIQLSNGHYPYYVEEAGPQPFQPASSSKDPEDASAFFNRYRNAVHQEDQHLAELLRGILSRPGGARTVIVYTSDHGEAFREHQQLGHTLSLFDEELRVPAWVYAPEGTLTAVERQNLKEQRARFVTHPDLTATILDLMGVWDEPGIARFRSKMIGRSLLRPLGAGPILPLTNCAPIWTCAFENWGVMKEHMKLHARAWDDSYRCFNLKLDPEEKVDLGPKACGHLELAARQYFRRLPGKRSQP